METGDIILIVIFIAAALLMLAICRGPYKLAGLGTVGTAAACAACYVGMLGGIDGEYGGLEYPATVIIGILMAAVVALLSVSLKFCVDEYVMNSRRRFRKKREKLEEKQERAGAETMKIKKNPVSAGEEMESQDKKREEKRRRKQRREQEKEAVRQKKEQQRQTARELRKKTKQPQQSVRRQIAPMEERMADPQGRIMPEEEYDTESEEQGETVKEPFAAEKQAAEPEEYIAAQEGPGMSVEEETAERGEYIEKVQGPRCGQEDEGMFGKKKKENEEKLSRKERKALKKGKHAAGAAKASAASQERQEVADCEKEMVIAAQDTQGQAAGILMEQEGETVCGAEPELVIEEADWEEESAKVVETEQDTNGESEEELEFTGTPLEIAEKLVEEKQYARAREAVDGILAKGELTRDEQKRVKRLLIVLKNVSVN